MDETLAERKVESRGRVEQKVTEMEAIERSHVVEQFSIFYGIERYILK